MRVKREVRVGSVSTLDSHTAPATVIEKNDVDVPLGEVCLGRWRRRDIEPSHSSVRIPALDHPRDIRASGVAPRWPGLVGISLVACGDACDASNFSTCLSKLRPPARLRPEDISSTAHLVTLPDPHLRHIAHQATGDCRSTLSPLPSQDSAPRTRSQPAVRLTRSLSPQRELPSTRKT